MAIKTQPRANVLTQRLATATSRIHSPADFPDTDTSNPFLPMARPKYLPAFRANPARRNPQRLPWRDRGDAAVGCASRTWCGELSWRGESIDRSVRIDANAFPNEVVLRTVVRGFALQNQLTNSSTGAVHRHKMTWKPHQCLSFTLCLPRHSIRPS